MGLWSIVVNSSTDIANLVTNPSGETNTTGYNISGAGATVAASTARARRGYRSISCVPSTALNNGMIYDSVTLVSGQTYTLAFDFWGVDNDSYKTYFASTDATAQTAAATAWSGNQNWQRISHTYESTASAEFRIYISKNDTDNVDEFFVDGVNVYLSDVDQGHIDGDQTDCVWDGTPHASTSYRRKLSQANGEVRNFDDYGFYIIDMPGAGVEEINIETRSLGPMPGTLYAGEKARERSFALTGDIIGTSLQDLHAKRKTLFGRLKNNGRLDDESFWLQYSGANSARPVRVKCRYTGGLTFAKPNGFTERVALRFVAEDPFYYEDGEQAAVLTLYDSDSDANYGIRRVNNVWSNINSVFNNNIFAYSVGPDKKLYVGGSFTAATGTSDGDYIVSLSDADSTALSAMATGFGYPVYEIITSPDGTVYAAGGTSGGGGGSYKLASWNGSAWTSIVDAAHPSSSLFSSLAIGPDGALYFAGVFDALGDTNGSGIVKYSGGAFSSLGTGLNGDGYSVAVGPNGNVYVGGTFADAGGVANTAKIACWNGTAWTALGTGFPSSDSVYAVAVDKAGNVYAGGYFGSAGGVTAANIAKWNGTAWSALGSGLNDVVYDIAVDDDGIVYVGGVFTSAGGINAAERVAAWNGSAWAHIPVNIPGTPSVYSVYTSGNDLFLGYNTSGTATLGSLNSINNSGSAIAYPRVVISRTATASTDTARIEYLENITTGARVWVNYLIQDGETLTLDFNPRKREVNSSYYGNVIGRAILRNSDFSKFYLSPARNEISIYVKIAGAPTLTGYMVWPITYHSLDGSST